MPLSDKIFFAIGLVDFACVLGFILATGLITRAEARSQEKQKATGEIKQAA